MGGVNFPIWWSGSKSEDHVLIVLRQSSFSLIYRSLLFAVLLNLLNFSSLCVCFFFFGFFLTPSLVKGSRPGKNVQLTENEIRGLCLKSREIFLSQPILLELEAPLKICGEF